MHSEEEQLLGTETTKLRVIGSSKPSSIGTHTAHCGIQLRYELYAEAKDKPIYFLRIQLRYDLYAEITYDT